MSKISRMSLAILLHLFIENRKNMAAKRDHATSVSSIRKLQYSKKMYPEILTD
ncbi:MAG: hypothetical protein ACRC23_02100 [Aeromonas jandaei]